MTGPTRSHGRKSIKATLRPRALMEDRPTLKDAFNARVITLFPELFPGVLGGSLTGRALDQGLWQLHPIDLRRFGEGKHRNVDDTPAGGGAGMVLRPDIMARAIDQAMAMGDGPIIYLSPRGRPFTQAMAKDLAKMPGATFICGRFEGLDERVIEHYRIQEVSLGDFVLTGGEIAAQAVLDATVRLIPGVLGNAESTEEESFSNGLLEHPQYTRPATWQGHDIPAILTSGNHKAIADWRRDMAEKITKERRPDLWDKFNQDYALQPVARILDCNRLQVLNSGMGGRDMNELKHTGYYSTEAADLTAFRAVVEDNCTAGDVPHAAEVVKNIPVYQASDLDLVNPAARQSVMAEWANVLLNGSGVLAVRGAYADTSSIDAATDIFHNIIASEAAAGGGADHFAAAGSNARIWNVVEKLCHASPEVFARYFGNLAISAVCEAWLGPGYQMTAQVNLVRPGGAAQTCHRDYHLGFMTPEQAAKFPAHIHRLSPLLTLQGAIAHVDMPVESGPTKLLPFSQRYDAGYMAYTRADFADYFDANCVQVPLSKGDALFFSPALFHAAGSNFSQYINRMANLIQISSPMGIAMESMDRAAMSRKLFGALRGMDDLSKDEVAAAIAACADGYAFPTSLDRDPPVGGLAPATMADLMHHALEESWSEAQLNDALSAQSQRRWGH